MPLSFPPAPSPGDVYTSGGKSWEWDGTVWNAVALAGLAAGGDLAGTYPNPTITTDAVTNVELANMAQATVKMRAAGAGTGDPIDGNATQLSTLLGLGTAAITDSADYATAAQGTLADTALQPRETYVAGVVYSNDGVMGGTRAAVLGRVHFCPIDIVEPTSIDALLIDIVTGGVGGLAHLYLVGAISTGLPDDPVLASAANVNVSASTTATLAALSATIAVTPGRYWAGLHLIAGSTTFRSWSASQQFAVPTGRSSSSSANGLTAVSKDGAGTSGTPLVTLAGLTSVALTNQGPCIGWRAA